MSLLGIDVSEFQLRPDYGRVRASGVAFVMARVSYGTRHPDGSYSVWNKAAIPAAGLLPGAYHYLVPGQSASAQADTFCLSADPNALHALDVEAPSVDVVGFVGQYREHYPTKTLLIYTGRDLWHRSTGGLSGPLFGPLWVAGDLINSYVPGTGTLGTLQGRIRGTGGLPFGGWSSNVMMQFTDSATVPGVSGNVDGDLFHGSAEDFVSLIGGTDMPLTQAEITAIANASADAVWNRMAVHVAEGGIVINNTPGLLSLQSTLGRIADDTRTAREILQTPPITPAP